VPLPEEPDLISRFKRDVELAGLVGEKDNAAIALLCAVSARLSKPLHLSVQGSSSAGKNHLLGCVALFLPETLKKPLSGMSPKALMHAGKDEFKHKAVFIAEYEGVKGADYAIRTMQSEQVIEWEFVESTPSGFRKRKNRVEGPAAFIQATTRPVLHPENETRLLFIEMDESSELTREILAHQAAQAATGAAVASEDVYRPWHELIEGLKLKKVLIPYAGKLAGCFPTDQVRARRDFPKLLGLIESSAFLHQDQRERHNEAVIADANDYALVKGLFQHCYDTGPDKAVPTLVKAAQAVSASDCWPTEFSVAELVRETGWGKSKVYQVLQRAEELGCVCQAQGWGKYRFIRALNRSNLNLPDTLP
jgi:hypothetical protein